jgi:predicted naringenin-chalcone synthase
LLARNGLGMGDIDHWLVHPGGPSIMDAVQGKLDISDEQMEVSRQVLADHGNCVSATILLVLQRYLREGRARRGEWGVMMSFGPGLTIEMCLLRF